MGTIRDDCLFDFRYETASPSSGSNPVISFRSQLRRIKSARIAVTAPYSPSDT